MQKFWSIFKKNLKNIFWAERAYEPRSRIEFPKFALLEGVLHYRLIVSCATSPQLKQSDRGKPPLIASKGG
jgi:hypothetical protein